ncbi:hypothetical protein KIPB_005311 [Kipferlia bialata]|uniref:Uncharacterized protein n=1 Tax=Kipferlia bialata TaxID=797122 RepID=A0A9K3GIY3_9EUKA|nr:hypothetical protein KIPB_005311 [Kipferlia bialata]|eukprot:g5311.t1
MGAVPSSGNIYVNQLVAQDGGALFLDHSFDCKWVARSLCKYKRSRYQGSIAITPSRFIIAFSGCKTPFLHVTPWQGSAQMQCVRLDDEKREIHVTVIKGRSTIEITANPSDYDRLVAVLAGQVTAVNAPGPVGQMYA